MIFSTYLRQLNWHESLKLTIPWKALPEAVGRNTDFEARFENSFQDEDFLTVTALQPGFKTPIVRVMNPIEVGIPRSLTVFFHSIDHFTSIETVLGKEPYMCESVNK